MHWKYSSLGVRSIVHGLESTGRANEIIALCKPETREALAKPMLTSWHDGTVVIDVSVATEKVLGPAGVEQVYYQAVKRSLGPVMEPFLKVMLALSGRKPQTVFSRMNENLVSIMKGVKVRWQETSPNSGVLTIEHQDDVLPVSFHAWAGSIRYSFDLVGAKGTVSPRIPSTDSRTLIFDVSWT